MNLLILIANGDYLLEVVDLDEILEVLCRQHNLSYPLRGDPWGARPYRNHRRCRHGNNRIACFQYACKRFALWRANYRYAQEVKASNGIVLKEPDRRISERWRFSSRGRERRRRLDGGRGRRRAGSNRTKEEDSRASCGSRGAVLQGRACVIILRAEPVPPLPRRLSRAATTLV